ncbi:ABC transporter permease [Abyssisolibacter fermentans]|uniref:ABC transporter permease n=1 Tax=Abyssisolibacter fermentans TaxID=1766203 RepID=UPI00083462DF|nr:ABC transporter permease [Abyssisolibacter fermentans]
MKKHTSIEDKVIPIIFIGIIILLWHISVSYGYIQPYMLPLPKDVIITFFKILPECKEHILVTVQEAVYGLLIAVVFSIILASLMDNIKILRKAIYPVLVISQTIPVIVLSPLFAVWFGMYMLPKVIMVVIVCFFPIVISLLEGLESVDEDLINMMKSMGASKFKIFTLVKFPASMVNFFSGLKVAATYSFMGAIIGEWMGGKAGLGLYILRVKKSFLVDKLFAAILLIIIFSMMIFKIISYMQYRFMPWTREK